MSQTHDDFANAFDDDDTAAAAATAGQDDEQSLNDQDDQQGAAAGDTPADDRGDGDASEATDQHDDEDDQDDAPQGSQPEANAQPATDWEAEAKRWKDRYSTLQGKYNAEVARAQRGNDGNAGDPSATTKPSAAAPAPQPSDEDDQLLAELDEQLPTVAKAVRKLIAKERQAIEQEVMGRIAPIERTAQESARERHFNFIRSAHQDFDEVVASPELAAWVDEQPAYLAATYRSVMERGTAQDVVDLLSRFKKESGIAPAPETQSVQAPKPRTDALRSAAAPRLRSHAAIPNRVDRNDFDAAWDD
jgi:hypothetical protein